MDYSKLTDEELLHNFSVLHDIEANEEWVRRYGINLPYRLDVFGRILNCISLQIMPEEMCDKLIREQANEVRTQRQLGRE
ncbi:hypothetical protein HWC53_gp120 [Bacillus phage vB_BmeM-Goe8]|uniref:Uncharacterized protein n=1 Tax=Bacillus phage vB_BmeM-Goe8 TaxID=2593638 RepID=A0A516KMZ4_9CAUD|nr:hypothetical protein HWC53_gp120 [Bacillus phage vB_BmeM-Goe8]QDP42969.1 hypothetical protein Goe8_c01960 [Bacillus phage vB_BmeM-Goe8]